MEADRIAYPYAIETRCECMLSENPDTIYPTHFVGIE
jgi:hypothetical protein